MRCWFENALEATEVHGTAQVGFTGHYKRPIVCTSKYFLTIGTHSSMGSKKGAAGVDNTFRKTWDKAAYADKAIEREKGVRI